MIHHLLIFWQRKLEDAYHENHRLQEENKRLKAEVERLTKAGDYLQRDVRLLSKDLLGKNPPTRHSEMEWHAAKEGTQS